MGKKKIKDNTDSIQPEIKTDNVIKKSEYFESEKDKEYTDRLEKKDAKKIKKAIEKFKKKRGEGKVWKKILRGQAHIQSTYNNTIVTITDLNGNVIAWSSAGHLGFKGAKKSTPYVASRVTKDVLNKIQNTGMKKIEVFVKGIGGGRDSAIRTLESGGLEVTSIKDVTPIPHNGCRPPKIRRV